MVYTEKFIEVEKPKKITKKAKVAFWWMVQQTQEAAQTRQRMLEVCDGVLNEVC